MCGSPCLQYVELNPVEAGIVQHPGQYQWSSYANNAQGRRGMVTPHPIYTLLGASTRDRCSSYRALLNRKYNSEEAMEIEKAIRAGVPLAGEKFISRVETKFGVQLVPKKKSQVAPSNE